MKKFFYIGAAILVACGQVDDSASSSSPVDQMSEMHDPDNSETTESPDRSTYIDEQIAAEVELSYGKEDKVYVSDGDLMYPVNFYEGQMVKASGAAAGFNLRFIPFDDYDEELEMEVKSDFDYDIDINLSREQNNKLGYVDYTDATGNLAWDYFENLFQVYYYEKGGINYPLKFVDLGKTEWDG